MVDRTQSAVIQIDAALYRGDGFYGTSWGLDPDGTIFAAFEDRPAIELNIDPDDWDLLVDFIAKERKRRAGEET